MPTLHLLIKGKVQGVFYRASAKEIANKIGITGWIKNTNEGDVEAVVTGSEEQLYEYFQWCSKGPLLAKVTDVIKTPHSEETFPDFQIIK